MKTVSKNIVIAAGGTGGHVFPAQALANHLLKKDPSYRIVFMGKGLDTNKFFDRITFTYERVDSASLSYKSPLKGFAAIFGGTIDAYRFLRKFRPSAVVGFGSFHSFTTVLAALLCRIPVILFESNSIPGKVNRLFSRFAVCTAVQFPAAKKHLKGESVDVSIPFGSLGQNEEMSKEEALQYFGLLPDKYTFLVFGGSQGAGFINEVFLDTLPVNKEKREAMQVIHLTGALTSPEETRKVYEEKGISACVKSFESNMRSAWVLADAAICRSGAATLAELIQFEVPSILIPYPHAKDGHQFKNALFMEEIGAAFCLEEKNVSTRNLGSLLEQFLDKKSTVTNTMKESVKEFKKKQNSFHFADFVAGFVEKKGEV